MQDAEKRGNLVNMMAGNDISVEGIDRIIEMAWEDRTPFEAIELQFGLNEQQVISLMRKELRPRSFNLWRKRTNRRKTKHQAIRNKGIDRFKSKMQRVITYNKISKRRN